MSGEKKFSDGEVEDFIKQFEEDMESGEMDDNLISAGDQITNVDDIINDGDDINVGDGDNDPDEIVDTEYNIDLFEVDEEDEDKDLGLTEIKDENILSESKIVADHIIESIIHEFIIKSLEEIAIVETTNSEFIYQLINDLLIKDVIMIKESDEIPKEKSEEIGIKQQKSDLDKRVSEIIDHKTIEEEEEDFEENIDEAAVVDKPEIEEILEMTYEEYSAAIVDEIIDKALKDEIVEKLRSVKKRESSDSEIYVMPEKIDDYSVTDNANETVDEVVFQVVTSGVSGTTIASFYSLTPSITPETESDIQSQRAPEESPTTSIDPDVLDPDDPLMIRFQNAFKTHLSKQKTRISDEIVNMKAEIKSKVKTEDTLSDEIYNLELKINQQRQRLNKLFHNIQEKITSWDNIMNIIAQLKIDYCEKLKQIDMAEKRESELDVELHSLTALVQQFTEWEKKQAAELTVTRVLSERQMADKKKMFTEKQKLDLLILGVRKEVLKYTREFKDIKGHIKNKTNELKIIQQAVADANADIQDLVNNNKKIMQLWGKNVVFISQRNKALEEINNNAEEHRVKFKSLETEVENTKKECDQLIKQNEQLTAKSKYVERTNENMRRKLKEEIERKRILEQNLAQVLKMRDSTELDLKTSEQEVCQITKKTNICLSEYEKVKAQNIAIEEMILENLFKQDSETKYSQIIHEKIMNSKNLIRQEEIKMADYENKIAKIMVDIETQKMLHACGELQMEDVNNEINQKEVILAKLHKELERTISARTKTQGEVDDHQHKLERIKEAIGECELSPEEIKIRELEKNISDLDEQATELQQFWLRQENHIVAISQQRTDLLNKTRVLNQQLILLDKKNLSIENEINIQEKERKNYLSTKESLQKKLLKLNERLYQKKGYKETLDNNNLNLQNQYLYDLKDAEDASITLQNEINEIDGKKGELYKKISEMQKELLAWEKKLQMAVETRQLLNSLHAEGGELANMKNEIHRMEIRYSQLRKAQEKLAHDMELCVTRRDGIVDLAIAREKRHTKGGVHYTRQQFKKKLEEQKSLLRQMTTEIRVQDKEFLHKDEERRQLSEQLKLQNEQLLGLQKATEQMDLQLAEGHLHRQKNLEVLVRLQRKCRYYQDFKGSKYKLLFRNESALEFENQKQKNINSDLISIVESLAHDFPSLQMPFTAILNNLRWSTTGSAS